MKLYNHLKSTLERYLLRGAFYQLLAVGALIGLVSVAGGMLLRVGVADPPGLGDSVWWAFLRLSDPGYLGDDEGAARRVIATVVTVLGYVLFMGSLVAIMTQWLNTTMRRLEQGYTAIHRKNHVLILGWTSRAGIVVRDLLSSSGRVQRFLRARGGRRLHVVVLAKEVTPKLMAEVRSRAAENWDPSQITMRSGSALRGEHLRRVDFLNASAIILPAGEFTDSGPDHIDTHTIKTLLSLSNNPLVKDPRQLPLVVAEILDERRAEIARSTYEGPLEVLASDTIVSRLIAQNVRQRGLSSVYSELLTHGFSNEIFVRRFEQLEGRKVAELHRCFPRAVLIGLLIREKDGRYAPKLNAEEDCVLERGDRLVLVARFFEEAEPELRDLAPQGSATDPPPEAAVHRPVPKEGEGLAGEHISETPRKVLLFGWSHKVPAILAELLQHDASTQISVVSSVASSMRESIVARHLGNQSSQVRHLEADYTHPADIVALEPQNYDNIVFVGSDWVRSGEASDARTIVGYLVLCRHLAEQGERRNVLVELLDAENVALLGTQPRDVLISPVMLSHMLAQVALRRELNVVFNELFASRGAEIVFRSPERYGLVGRTLNFEELSQAVRVQGETALGFSKLSPRGAIEVSLNPDRAQLFQLRHVDEVVVVASNRVGLA